MDLVTVIIQAYNSDDTIIETLESVKKQDYPHIELIITDDCSRDNTVEIVEKWVKENEGSLDFINIIKSDVNTGISANSNRALKVAKGKYVEFLAADDLMSVDAITEYVKFCEQNPKKLPISKVRLFSQYDKFDENVQKYCQNCYETAKSSYKEQYKKLLVKNWIVAPAAAFFPTELMRSLGGYDESYRWFEDYPFSLKCMSKGYCYGFIDKELIHYRISEGSITGSNISPLKRDEARLFFRQKAGLMIRNAMAMEALKQSRYWLNILIKSR